MYTAMYICNHSCISTCLHLSSTLSFLTSWRGECVFFADSSSLHVLPVFFMSLCCSLFLSSCLSVLPYSVFPSLYALSCYRCFVPSGFLLSFFPCIVRPGHVLISLMYVLSFACLVLSFVLYFCLAVFRLSSVFLSLLVFPSGIFLSSFSLSRCFFCFSASLSFVPSCFLVFFACPSFCRSCFLSLCLS